MVIKLANKERKGSKDGVMVPRTCSKCGQDHMTNVIDEPYVCGDCAHKEEEIEDEQVPVPDERTDWAWRLYQHMGFRVVEDDEQLKALNAAIESIIANEIEDRYKRAREQLGKTEAEKNYPNSLAYAKRIDAEYKTEGAKEPEVTLYIDMPKDISSEKRNKVWEALTNMQVGELYKIVDLKFISYYKPEQVVGVIHTDHLKEDWQDVMDELAVVGMNKQEVLQKEEIVIKFKNNKTGSPTKWTSPENRTDSLSLMLSLQKWSESKYTVVIEPYTLGKNIDLGNGVKTFRTEALARKEYDDLKVSLLDGDFTCVMVDYRIYFDWPSDKANIGKGFDGYEEAFTIEANVIQPLLDRYPPEEYPRQWLKTARTVSSGLDIIQKFCVQRLEKSESVTDEKQVQKLVQKMENRSANILGKKEEPKCECYLGGGIQQVLEEDCPMHGKKSEHSKSSTSLFVDSHPFRDIKCNKCGQPIKKWVFHVCEKKGKV
jgi:hypothetical protein